MLCVIKSTCARLLQKTAVFKVSQKAQLRLLNISCQVERLASRGLVRVSGDDVTSFLQGIVTNDMKHFQESSKSLFAMFLNTKGRVLFDSIVYKTKNENTYFIECDHQALQDIVKHLKMYRVRRKIDIDSVDDEWKLWVIFNPKEVENTNDGIKNVKQEVIVPCSLPSYDSKKENAFFTDLILSNNATVYSDPRLLNLGCRVIAPDNEDIMTCVRNAGAQVESSSPWSYRSFRYRLGIGEGIEELPIGKCFPLEANCDYLHGVSFHKGCYIGQELTARTHHTGVVRKRLMPLMLYSESTDNFLIDTPIEAVIREKNTAIGKLRGIERNSAIGLMRIAEALEVDTFSIRTIEGKTLRPFWWPQELPKERIDSGSNKRS